MDCGGFVILAGKSGDANKLTRLSASWHLRILEQEVTEGTEVWGSVCSATSCFIRD
jgi:hypothetical protein